MDLGGEGAFADAGDVGLGDADYGADRVGPTPVPVTAPPAVAEELVTNGIGAVVDVEQRALGAFEHDVLAVRRWPR